MRIGLGLLLAQATAFLAAPGAAMPTARRLELREQVRELFKHGFDGYMRHAYPADELRPLTCDALWRDADPDNVGVNDIHANASITLIDTLSSLPAVYPEAYPDAVRRVAEEISFDQDVKVQVFEMTIRAVGALLSTHQTLAALPDAPEAQAEALGIEGAVDIKRHAGRMLALARDLADRLLPAFDTPTGLPYARVNLRSGVPKGETLETLDDSRYMDIFDDAYAALQTHVRSEDGFFYRPISLRNTALASPSYVDSLSAFFPGVLALAGDLQSAIRAHLVFWNVWQKYSALPEAWDPASRGVAWGGWPGRPEFIESTYYLHRATGDDFYLKVGERFLDDVLRRAVTSCGLASLGNVETGKQENRMESFFLSETLKYLYHLFDPADRPLDATVFSTEGHPLRMPQALKRSPSAQAKHNRRRENLQCPRYEPATLGGIPVGIEGRADFDYAQWLVFGDSDAEDARPLTALWKAKPKPRLTPSLLSFDGGECIAPVEPVWSLQVLLSPTEADPAVDDAPEDRSPSPHKVRETASGWEIADITGLRLNVRWRPDGAGYEASAIGPHRVRSGQDVVITDAKMRGYLATSGAAPPEVVRLRFFAAREPRRPVLEIFAAAASFGRPFAHALPPSPEAAAQRPFHPAEPGAGWEPFAKMPLHHLRGDGCAPITSPAPPGTVYLALRGGCDFSDKAAHVQAAGGAGVIFLNTQEGELFKPAAGAGDPDSYRDVGAALLDKVAGETVEKFVNVLGNGAFWVEFEDHRHVSRGDSSDAGGMSVNGHDIVNVRVVRSHAAAQESVRDEL